MSREIIRQDIATAVEAAAAAFNEYPLIVEYDNRIIVDVQTQQNPFLCVRTRYMDSQQVDLSNRPLQRFMGVIQLQAAVKLGSGTAQANRLLDHFYSRLQRRTFGSVRTYMADTGGTSVQLGWEYHAMVVPFWSDHLT